MSEKMSELQSEIQKFGKRNKKHSAILKNLAKFDSSFNTIKVTIFDGEIIDEKDHFLIAPFKNFLGHLPNHYSTDSTTEYSIENSNIENNFSSHNDIDLENYPDSSDFSDDE